MVDNEDLEETFLPLSQLSDKNGSIDPAVCLKDYENTKHDSEFINLPRLTEEIQNTLGESFDR